MTSPRIQPVIMSGGAGTRLWPLSRLARPKQFAPISGERSLFQEAVLRVAPAPEGPFAAPLIIGGGRHAGLISEQLAAIGVVPRAIVTEPEPKNTGAVAAVAAGWTAESDPDAIVLLMPADHRITDPRGFRAAVRAGAAAAQAGAIVTFGIKPAEANTGYGYIERSEEIAAGVFGVRAFREKPDREMARRYVEGGAHFWNAGIFLFAPDVMLDALSRHAPAIRDASLAALAKASRAEARIDLDPASFAACPADSIDYAVMEKAANVAVVGPVDIGWSDVGSWSAIEASDDPRIIARDSEGATIRTEGPFVGVIGVPDVVVVATGDAVLVVAKDRAQDVKGLVEELKRRGRTDLL